MTRTTTNRRLARPPSHRPSPGRTSRRGPSLLPEYAEYEVAYEQSYRIQDTSFAVYELYVGEDGPPDFLSSSQPVATSLTLPFAWTPSLPSGGTVNLHVVVRVRNGYDLESFNVYETVLRFVNGDALLGPIFAPVDLVAYDRGTGRILVMAKYLAVDDPDPADTWELYVGEGADPVPGVDTPAYEGDMVFLDVESVVSQFLESYAPGTVVHIIASAVRSADGLRASSDVLLHTMADSIDLTDGFSFGGHTYEQQGPE